MLGGRDESREKLGGPFGVAVDGRRSGPGKPSVPSRGLAVEAVSTKPELSVQWADTEGEVTERQRLGRIWVA
jgi:hypothetical protein